MDELLDECICSGRELLDNGCTCGYLNEDKEEHIVAHPVIPVITQGIIMMPAHESLAAGDVYYIGETPVGIVLNTTESGGTCHLQLNFSLGQE